MSLKIFKYSLTAIIIVICFFMIGSSVLADCQADEVCIDSPIGATTPQQLVGQAIKGVLGIVGSLALAMFIYGGFVWMLAGGSAEKVQKGKNVLVWAAIGLVVVFSAYALVKFVFEGLGITS